MKLHVLIPLATLLAAGAAHSQTIYRCPSNVYTNDAAEAKAKGCTVMSGGNITVVQGTKVNGAAAANSAQVRVATAPGTSPAGARIDSDEQRARDADARAILQAELKKAESRQADLAREYNNGEPEMLGPEHRNRQKYLDRVAELKASMARNENDIAGIRRELDRVK